MSTGALDLQLGASKSHNALYVYEIALNVLVAACGGSGALARPSINCGSASEWPRYKLRAVAYFALDMYSARMMAECRVKRDSVRDLRLIV